MLSAILQRWRLQPIPKILPIDIVLLQVFYGGNQCTANAATACVASLLVNIETWNTATIDQILRVGDNLYRVSRAQGPRPNFPGQNDNYLAASELFNEISLFNRRVKFATGDDIFAGQLIEHIDETFACLKVALNNFFSAHDCGILTTNGQSVAIMHNVGMYHYFDSHSRDERGSPCANGLACVITLRTKELLHDKIIDNLSINGRINEYNITAISVTDVSADNLLQSVVRPNVEERIEHPQVEMSAVSVRQSSVPIPVIRPVTISNVACTTDVVVHDAGELVNICTYCGAKFFTGENFYCCRGGLIKLPELEEYPLFLKELLTGQAQTAPRISTANIDLSEDDHEISDSDGENEGGRNRDSTSHNDKNLREFKRLSKRYRRDIMIYNNMFSFACFGATVHYPPGGNFSNIYIIRGLIYYAIRDITPALQNPKYGQLYFLGAEESVPKRAERLPRGCDIVLINQIENLLRQINPYAAMYMSLREKMHLEQQRMLNQIPQQNIGIICLTINENPQLDRRRYNIPRNVGEVAVIYEGTDGELPPCNDLRVFLRDDPSALTFLNTGSCHLDPLCFPLLFPKGELGWQIDIEFGETGGNLKRKRISRLEFIKYRLLSIRNSFSPLLNAGRLSQQFIVHCYCIVESDRLLYIRLNQRKIRAQQYDGLINYLQRREDGEIGENIGRMVILPSTFVGSPRAMQQNYQDAMAIVALYGRPDLFVTFTCNPKWPEIMRNKEEWESHYDRVDLICRVFFRKLSSFLDDLTVNNVFGKCIAYDRVSKAWTSTRPSFTYARSGE